MDDAVEVVHVGQSENVCVVCGEPVPEGREVCYICEHTV